MRAEMKFCGLTRPEDAAYAAQLGAAYAGVVFAGGPRSLTPARASTVLDGAGGAVRRVGVFGAHSEEDLVEIAHAIRLDVVQLHGDPVARDIEMLRRRFEGEIWAVSRVDGATLPPETVELFDRADAVVLDARVTGMLGGSGRAFDWAGAAREVSKVRGGARLVLAGGLTAENVGLALRSLDPDVVDVSSGVERQPGVKDHAKMREFAAAVAAFREAA